MQGYRTIISALVALSGTLLQQSGVEIDQEGLTTAIMQIGGIVFSIYYRWIATRNLNGGTLK